MLSGIQSMPQVFAGSRFRRGAEIRYLVRTGKIREFIDNPP